MKKEQFSQYVLSNTDNDITTLVEAFNNDGEIIIFMNLIKLIPVKKNKINYYQSSFFSKCNTIEGGLDDIVNNLRKEKPDQATEEEINIINEISNKEKPIWKFISRDNLEFDLIND